MVEVIVCVKQVLSVAQIKVDREAGKLITAGVPKVISESDKSAVEQAVRLKEKYGGKVKIVSVGSDEAREALRESLAIGADEAYLLTNISNERVDGLVTARLLASMIRKIGKYDLILCGDASEDLYAGQVGPSVGAILGIPVITYARYLEVKGDTVRAERDLGKSIQVVEAKMPSLVTVVREICEPRLPTLSAILTASRKPFIKWDLNDVGAKEDDIKESLLPFKSYVPKTERRQEIIKGQTDELVKALLNVLTKEGLVK